jgi:hypothetical protein
MQFNKTARCIKAFEEQETKLKEVEKKEKQNIHYP